MTHPVVLYVEDEDAAVFLVEIALKEADLRVQLCRVSDGEQALAFLSRLAPYQTAPQPDLILLDLNLPRKNGFEVLDTMQKADHLRSIPVVVLTSSALASDARRAMALGAKEFITKPSTFDGFIAVLRNIASYLPRNNGAAA